MLICEATVTVSAIACHCVDHGQAARVCMALLLVRCRSVGPLDAWNVLADASLVGINEGGVTTRVGKADRQQLPL
jgi:hypothetical protein